MARTAADKAEKRRIPETECRGWWWWWLELGKGDPQRGWEGASAAKVVCEGHIREGGDSHARRTE